MKKLVLILAFLLPAVSFAAPLTVSQRNDILRQIAVLEAQIQALETSTTPPVGNTPAPIWPTPVDVSTPPAVQLEDCQGHAHPLDGTKVHTWCRLVPTDI